MFDVVINYDKNEDRFKVYEPSSDTIIVTTNLTEALLNLSKLLESLGINGGILDEESITYHLDSGTLKSMINSNIELLKRLSDTAPSGFTIAERKFGPRVNNIEQQSKGFKTSSMNRKSKAFGSSSSYKKSKFK